jgi:hypothetical protein
MATLLDGFCTSGQGGTLAYPELWTISLLNGTVLRWAAWDIPITFGGHTYLAAGPYIQRSAIKQALKLEVSQTLMTIQANPLMQVNGIPVLQAINNGVFAGATVEVDRVYTTTVWPTVDTSNGVVIWFVGQVGEVDMLTRAQAQISVKCPFAWFNSPFPRNRYLSGCRHSLFDPGCSLTLASYQVSGTAQSGSTNVTINTNLTQHGPLSSPGTPTVSYSSISNLNVASYTYYIQLTFVGGGGESLPSPEVSIILTGGGVQGTTNKVPLISVPSSPPSGATGWNVYVGTISGGALLQNPAPLPLSTTTYQALNIVQGAPPPAQASSGWFTLGTITFTSGALAGRQQMIVDYTNPSGSGIIQTTPPLPVAPSAGDSFIALPGCDKTMTTCTSKFSNLTNYAGLPFIPLPEVGI